ncbi:MAG TPA: hydroxyethylthiazole kinase [Candidatus Mcinerneyibacteriales bacterium]|nr:hydroxyethylthiazole kinase [Candidatus Mcinerneyibacteriales bacterium]
MNAEELLRRAALLVDSVPGKRPLIYHITNDVTIHLSANATLALGGAPVMSSSPRESADITSLSDALVINIGTPGRNSVKAMTRACRRASAEGIPAVLDPVGAGFTAYRTGSSDHSSPQEPFPLSRGMLRKWPGWPASEREQEG